MITLFEKFNFSNYIKKIIIDGQIPSASFKNLGSPWSRNQLIHPQYYKPLTYQNLMRACTLLFLLSYKGNDPKLVDYIESLKTSNSKKKHEIINKIGRSRKTLNKVNKILPNFKCYDCDCDDIEILNILISNYDIVFTEENFLSFIKAIEGVTEKSDRGEGIVAHFLSTYFQKTSVVVKNDDESADIHGIDLVKLNKETLDEEETIQVKTISHKKTTLRLEHNIIYIDNTDFELHTYNENTKPLEYDYLAIYDDYNRKLYYINYRAILRIDTNMVNKYRNIRIIIGRWALKYKTYFNVFDIGPKYAGVNVQKVFY